MESILLLFLIPLAAASLILILRSEKHARALSLAVSLGLLGWLIAYHQIGIGSEFQSDWIPQLNIRFHLRLDPLSFVFVLLTLIVIPYALFTVKNERGTVRHFYALLLILESLAIGFFTAQDLFLFTLFWEGMLIPLYLLMLINADEDRQNISQTFILFMISGSVLMLMSLFALYTSIDESTFAIDQLAKAAKNLPHSSLYFGLFALAFAVKTPLFPFHGWLPSTYVNASMPVTLVLAAILSKAGIYGFLRIGRELFPDEMLSWSPLLITLAAIGVVYSGLAAYRQTNLKKMISYSSLSHVNLILAGLFAVNPTGDLGAIFQVFSHAVIITALFLLAYWISQRTGSWEINQERGLAKQIPWLCWMTFLVILASIALPGTSGFVGELLVLYGVFQSYPVITAILALSIILSAIYFLSAMRKLFFGPLPEKTERLSDLTSTEIWIVLPLVFLILGLGISPSPLLEMIQLALEPNR